MSLLNLLVPPACGGCGRYGRVLCETCQASFHPPSNPADRFVCADPGVTVGDDLEAAVAAFAYSGAVRRALARLKYGGATRLAQPLAEHTIPTLRLLTHLVGQGTLVPVPVHPDRLRQRGYNQTELIARHLSSAAGLPFADLLVRRRATTQQHRLNRIERLRNLRAAFTLRNGARSPPAVILVDDILTTSATLEACAATLREGGADRVVGVTIAREI